MRKGLFFIQDQLIPTIYCINKAAKNGLSKCEQKPNLMET